MECWHLIAFLIQWPTTNCREFLSVFQCLLQENYIPSAWKHSKLQIGAFTMCRYHHIGECKYLPFYIYLVKNKINLTCVLLKYFIYKQLYYKLEGNAGTSAVSFATFTLLVLAWCKTFFFAVNKKVVREFLKIIMHYSVSLLCSYLQCRKWKNVIVQI